MNAADARAHRGVDGARERVRLAAAAAAEKKPHAPVAERGELGVAGGEQPVIRAAAAGLGERADEVLAACVIEFADGAAHGVQVRHLACEAIHDGAGSLRPNCSDWQSEGDGQDAAGIGAGGAAAAANYFGASNAQH
jgi:hypothetical protein